MACLSAYIIEDINADYSSDNSSFRSALSWARLESFFDRIRNQKIGVAIGVDAQWIYQHYKKSDFSKGKILFLSTDGIWDARQIKPRHLLFLAPFVFTFLDLRYDASCL